MGVVRIEERSFFQAHKVLFMIAVMRGVSKFRLCAGLVDQ
jgi:hypothetical protein